MENYRILLRNIPFPGRGRQPAPGAEHQSEPGHPQPAVAQRLRPVRVQPRAARKEPLQRLRRSGNRQRDRFVRPGGTEIHRRGVPPRPVRPTCRVGRRLRAADRPVGPGAHPLVEAVALRRCRFRNMARIRHYYINAVESREKNLDVDRHGAGRGEARRCAGRLHQDD